MSAKIQNCTWLFDRKEELVQLYKAHKSFPYDVSPATVQRYFRRGIITPNGHFRLETVSCGNKRFTSLEAIERFLRVQQGENAVQTMSIPTSSGMTAAERKREMKRLGLRPQGEAKPGKPKADVPAKIPGKNTQIAQTRKRVGISER